MRALPLAIEPLTKKPFIPITPLTPSARGAKTVLYRVNRKDTVENDVPIKNGIIIPSHELKITASRAGGPGGQHVNKTNTRITVRWNVYQTNTLPPELKERVIQKLAHRLTNTGDLIIHQSSERSQLQNKESALGRLAFEIRNALHVPKKRMKTRVSKTKKEARLQAKMHRGKIKQLRSVKIHDF